MTDENTKYQEKLKQEQERFKDVIDVNDLPPIFHYWSHKYLRPMFEEFGVIHPDDWFSNNLLESAKLTGSADPVFLSIGAGNCDTEVRVAKLLKQGGATNFTIECLDLNPAMLDRGRAMAEAENVQGQLRFVEGDFNKWAASRTYDGIMANQSLHHVMNLEGLFSGVRAGLHQNGLFVISDMIGRNGHMRWPEALREVHRFWEELPNSYRYNHLLKRNETQYDNWDCSGEGFEGIRAQDILPLLLKDFQFYKFIGFGNIVDPFIDRAFGHNFDADAQWDRDFVDRLHARDEAGFAEGSLTPTHMLAVLTMQEPAARHYSRGLSPEASMHGADFVPSRV